MKNIIKRLFAIPVATILVFVLIAGFFLSILLSAPYWVITGRNLFVVLDNGFHSFTKKNIDPLFGDALK